MHSQNLPNNQRSNSVLERNYNGLHIEDQSTLRCGTGFAVNPQNSPRMREDRLRDRIKLINGYKPKINVWDKMVLEDVKNHEEEYVVK